MKDLADIRVLTEAEGTVSVRVDKISSSSSSFFFCCFFPPCSRTSALLEGL